MGKPANYCEQSAGTPETVGQQQRRPRIRICLATGGGAALGLLSLLPQSPVLVWNFTESVPVGLYHIEQAAAQRGDVVALAPSGRVRSPLDAYGVLPAGRLLLKQIAAMPGDTVCRNSVSITVNGVSAATALLQTRAGKALPVWSGCRGLLPGEVFLLAPHPASFDSRYFGTIDDSQIVGVAHPIFTLPSSQERL